LKVGSLSEKIQEITKFWHDPAGPSKAKDMLRIIVRIIQLQFFLLCVFILCNWIAGPENAVLWFALIAVMLLALGVVGKIVQRSHRFFPPNP
jgi:hypothetical protein